MVEEDLERWLDFTNRPHSYNEPCTCNGSIYRRWIADLNKLV